MLVKKSINRKVIIWTHKDKMKNNRLMIPQILNRGFYLTILKSITIVYDKYCELELYDKYSLKYVFTPNTNNLIFDIMMPWFPIIYWSQPYYIQIKNNDYKQDIDVEFEFININNSSIIKQIDEIGSFGKFYYKNGYLTSINDNVDENDIYKMINNSDFIKADKFESIYTDPMYL